jgi:hypothetical protein
MIPDQRAMVFSSTIPEKNKAADPTGKAALSSVA